MGYQERCMSHSLFLQSFAFHNRMQTTPGPVLNYCCLTYPWLMTFTNVTSSNLHALYGSWLALFILKFGQWVFIYLIFFPVLAIGATYSYSYLKWLLCCLNSKNVWIMNDPPAKSGLAMRGEYETCEEGMVSAVNLLVTLTNENPTNTINLSFPM